MKHEHIWESVLAEIESPFDDESDSPVSGRYANNSGNFEWLQSLGFHFGQVSFSSYSSEFIRFKLVKLIAAAVCWINELDEATAEQNKVKPVLDTKYQPVVADDKPVDYTMTVEEHFHFADCTVFVGPVDNGLLFLTPADATLIAADGTILEQFVLSHERRGTNGRRAVVLNTNIAHLFGEDLSGAVLKCKLQEPDAPSAIVDQLT